MQWHNKDVEDSEIHLTILAVSQALLTMEAIVAIQAHSITVATVVNQVHFTMAALTVSLALLTMEVSKAHTIKEVTSAIQALFTMVTTTVTLALSKMEDLTATPALISQADLAHLLKKKRFKWHQNTNSSVNLENI